MRIGGIAFPRKGRFERSLECGVVFMETLCSNGGRAELRGKRGPTREEGRSERKGLRPLTFHLLCGSLFPIPVGPVDMARAWDCQAGRRGEGEKGRRGRGLFSVEGVVVWSLTPKVYSRDGSFITGMS
jgi:hypothetical protein